MWPEVADTHPPASGREGPSDGLDAFTHLAAEDPGAVRAVFIAIAGSTQDRAERALVQRNRCPSLVLAVFCPKVNMAVLYLDQVVFTMLDQYWTE